MLRCFLGSVSGPKGLKHQDSGVKQICIDLLSLVGQHFFLLAKKCDDRPEKITENGSEGRSSEPCFAFSCSNTPRGDERNK